MYTYVTVIGATVVLSRFSFGSPVPIAAVLAMPATADLLQLNAVVAVALVGVYENTALSQIAAGVSVLVSFGVGLTVTVTFCMLLQLLAVSVYT